VTCRATAVFPLTMKYVKRIVKHIAIRVTFISLAPRKKTETVLLQLPKYKSARPRSPVTPSRPKLLKTRIGLMFDE
jgi:hypothetical protein